MTGTHDVGVRWPADRHACTKGIRIYGRKPDIRGVDPLGLFGIDDVWGALYSATRGWSPSRGLVDSTAGFGDGAYRAVTLGIANLQTIRDAMGADGGINHNLELAKSSVAKDELRALSALFDKVVWYSPFPEERARIPQYLGEAEIRQALAHFDVRTSTSRLGWQHI